MGPSPALTGPSEAVAGSALSPTLCQYWAVGATLLPMRGTHHFLGRFLLETLGRCMGSWSLGEGRVSSEPWTGPAGTGGVGCRGTHLGEVSPASSGAVLCLWLSSRRDLRCCS